MKNKHWLWLGAAALLVLVAAVYLVSGGNFGDAGDPAAPGENGNREPGPGNGDNGREEENDGAVEIDDADDDGGPDEADGPDDPGEEDPDGTDGAVDPAVLQALAGLKSDLDGLYFQMNHILDRYDRLAVTAAEAIAGLAQVRDGFSGLGRDFRSIGAPPGTAAEKVKEDFAAAADLSAAAAAMMIDYLETGGRDSLGAFQDKIRQAEYHIVAGEAGLEQLGRDG